MTAMDLWTLAETKAARPGRPARFAEADHPRDRLGKFVEVGGTVKIRGGGTGIVEEAVGGGRIRVRREDGRTVVVDAGLTEQTRSARQNADAAAAEQAAPAPVDASAPNTPEPNADDADRMAARQAAQQTTATPTPAPAPEVPGTLDDEGRLSFRDVDELRAYLRAGAPHAERASAQNVLDEIANDPTLKLVQGSLGGLATRGKGGKSQLIHSRSGAFVPLDGVPGRRVAVDRVADSLIGESISWRPDWGLETRELGKRHPDLAQVIERAIDAANDWDPKPDPAPAPDPTPQPPATLDGLLAASRARLAELRASRDSVDEMQREEYRAIALAEAVAAKGPDDVRALRDKAQAAADQAEAEGARPGSAGRLARARTRVSAFDEALAVDTRRSRSGVPAPDGISVDVAPGGFRVGGQVEVEQPDFQAPGQPRRWFPGEVTAIHATGGRLTGRASQYDVSVRTEDGVVSVHRVGARGGNNRIRPVGGDTTPGPSPSRAEWLNVPPSERPEVTVRRRGKSTVVNVTFAGRSKEVTTVREFSHVAVAAVTTPDGREGLWVTLTRAPDSAVRELNRLRDGKGEGWKISTPIAHALPDTVGRPDRDPAPTPDPDPDPTPTPSPAPAPSGEQPPPTIGGFRYPNVVRDRAAFGVPDEQGRIIGTGDTRPRLTGYLTRHPGSNQMYLIADPRTEPAENGRLFPDLRTGTAYRWDTAAQRWSETETRPRGVEVVTDVGYGLGENDLLRSFTYTEDEITGLGKLVKPWLPDNATDTYRDARFYINNWASLIPGLRVSRGRWAGGRQVTPNSYSREDAGFYSREQQEALNRARVYFSDGRLVFPAVIDDLFGADLVNSLHERMGRDDRVREDDEGRLVVGTATAPDPDPAPEPGGDASWTLAAGGLGVNTDDYIASIVPNEDGSVRWSTVLLDGQGTNIVGEARNIADAKRRSVAWLGRQQEEGKLGEGVSLPEASDNVAPVLLRRNEIDGLRWAVFLDQGSGALGVDTPPPHVLDRLQFEGYIEVDRGPIPTGNGKFTSGLRGVTITPAGRDAYDRGVVAPDGQPIPGRRNSRDPEPELDRNARVAAFYATRNIAGSTADTPQRVEDDGLPAGGELYRVPITDVRGNRSTQWVALINGRLAAHHGTRSGAVDEAGYLSRIAPHQFDGSTPEDRDLPAELRQTPAPAPDPDPAPVAGGDPAPALPSRTPGRPEAALYDFTTPDPDDTPREAGVRSGIRADVEALDTETDARARRDRVASILRQLRALGGPGVDDALLRAGEIDEPTAPTPRTPDGQETELDRAVAAFRADPSEANRARLLALQQAAVTAGNRRLADEYIARTRGLDLDTAQRRAGTGVGGDPVGRFSEQGETTPTSAANLTVGQVIVQLSGNGSPPRYFEVTRAWTRADRTIGWRERVPGATEESVRADATRLFSVADNPPAPAPEIDEVPEVIDRLNPPTEDTGPTILARRLQAGDRIRVGGQVRTIVDVADGEHPDSVALTFDYAGQRQTEQVGRQAVLDWFDDGTLPTPDRHARDINARRPPLYTYQRRRLVALGLDHDTDPLVAAAAQRIRTRQALSVEEARALASRLRATADGSDHKTQQRTLRRMADVLDATAVASGSVDASGRFDVNARPIRGTVSDITLGDQAAFVDATGRTVGGRIEGMRSTMGGRLVEVLVDGVDGREWHLLTKGTVTWRLPDLPAPVHIAEPPKRRKLREHITADRVADGDTVTLNHEGQVITGRVTSPPYIAPDGAVTFWMNAKLSANGWMTAATHVTVRPGDGGPQVIRTERSNMNYEQSWDAVMPDERRRKVPASKIGVGDRIEWTPPDGSDAKMVTITRVNEALAPDGEVIARTFLFRDDFGDTGSDIAQPDDEMVLAAKVDEDTRAAMQQALRENAATAHRKKVQQELDTTYSTWMVRVTDALSEQTAEGGQALLDALNRATAADKDRVADRARAVVARVRGNNRFEMPPADDPDVVAVSGMLRDELDRIAGSLRESIMEMPPFPDEDEATANARVIRQWRVSPPSQARNTEAMARALIAGHAVTSGVRPERRSALSRPPAAEGELAGRMAAYRAALPDDLADIGNARVRRASYARLNPADLERGLLPSIAMSEVSGMDVARDGGPGEAAMSHLAVIQAAGRELSDEYERRVAGLPSQQTVDVARHVLEARKADAKRTREILSSVTQRAYDDLAERYGFSDWAAAVRAKEAGPEGANGRWGDAFDAHMAVYENVDGAPAVKRLRGILKIENDRVKAAQTAYDEALRGGSGARRDVALGLLAELRPFGGKKLSYIEAGPGRPLDDDDPLVRGMRYAEAHYPTDWLELIDKAKDGKPWKLESVPRGSHSWFAQQINLSDDGFEQVPGTGKRGRVAIHELGHGMERAVPGLAAMERAFLWSRTSTGEVGDREREEKKHLGASYDSHENAYHDEFPTAYTGKDYGTPGGDSEAYEVFTTGIESMFAGSNYLDEDFRAWMFGTLALLGETDNRAAQFAEERRATRRAKAAEVAKDSAGVPWRLDYDYLSGLDEEKLDELADHLVEGLGEGDPREGQRWEDYEAYVAAQEGVDELVSSLTYSSDEEITAAVDEFLATNGRPGLTHPRVGGTPNRGRGVTRAEVQDEYATFVHLQYLDAEDNTRGHLLNDQGESRGVNPRDLFTGRIEDVYRYASPELLEYWENTRRVGWSEYYYERTKSPGSARAAQRQAEQNAGINRDRTNKPVSSTRRRRR